ncbi:restriction endonuclease subunit S [Desulfurobacterium atlanticum]|uniref:Type I restriction enzyme, S subunit n=1 Tax=Desulfurobacterium atlanticum TaxID=240169 RepID=A0A239A298_9BACT|nr:restriction endonuclease subunit S [Desulfurobacterium atlanticum]SNR89033.1 type I restriction enzyme, S subunit [Desulfurobacterium atlanticum]
MGEKIPKGWKKVKLGEVVWFNPKEKLLKGHFAKKIPMEALSPFTRKIQFFYLEEYKGGVKFRNGDTLVARITPSLENGKTAFVDILKADEIGFGSTEFIVLRNKKGITDKKFVYYLALSPVFRETAIKSMTGSSGRQRVQTEVVKNHEILLPPLPEQKAIASVLSSLDDKIDLLHRQNKTLEKMAETLFRQWFIEEAKEDWEEVSLGDSELAKIIKSGIKKFDGIKIYLATGDVNDTKIQGGECITYYKRPSRANMQPVEFSVWFAKKGGVRKLLMFDDYSDIDNIILSTGFTGLKTTELSHYYIWCFILSEEFQEIKDSYVSGTVQPDINNEGVRQIMILKPDKETLEKFNKIVKPYFMKIQSNKNQIRTLEKLRDTLLPKLMSGKVRVKV